MRLHTGAVLTYESALKIDSGRKIPFRIEDSNRRKYYALAFQLDVLPTELFPPQRERERDRQTDRQTDRDRDREESKSASLMSAVFVPQKKTSH